MSELLRLLQTAHAVRRHASAGRKELQEFRDARLRELLVHAYERVPYYRRLFDRHRLHPRHVRGAADLDLIPLTSKEELRAQRHDAVIAQGLDLSRLQIVRTNGSTGEPFVVRRTWLEQSFHELFRYRWRREIGLGLRDRVALVAMLPAASPRRKLDGGLSARLIHPTRRIDGMQEPADIVRQLEQFQPHMVVGPPGMLSRVAEHLLARGGANLKPRFLVSGGEVLTPLMQRRLTEGFGVAPTQTYACHEVPLMGWECSTTGEIHSCDDGCIVEVLRDGRPVNVGEEGEVVVTNLHAYAMPLIRYRLADVAVRGAEQCLCGKPFSTIRAIRGRMIDYFPLPDGRVLHPYHIVDSFMPEVEPWIRQYQLEQDRPNRIVLTLVTRGTPAPTIEQQISQRVTRLLGTSIDFQVRVADDIPLGPGGKFRHSRSLVSTPHG
jgi:phenylacetate-CoA ligase